MQQLILLLIKDKERHVYLAINIMAAADLVMQGGGASAAMA